MPVIPDVGMVFTVTADDVLAEQFCALVTVTVYVPLLLKVLVELLVDEPPDHA